MSKFGKLVKPLQSRQAPIKNVPDDVSMLGNDVSPEQPLNALENAVTLDVSSIERLVSLAIFKNADPSEVSAAPPVIVQDVIVLFTMRKLKDPSPP